MSLVNDALRRASQTTQKENAPLSLVREESVPERRRSVMPIVVAALLLGLAGFVGLKLFSSKPAPVAVKAAPHREPPAVAKPSNAPVAPAPAPVVAAVPVAPTNAPVALMPANTTEASTATNTFVATAPAPSAPALPAQPLPPMRLQGIYYRRSNPSVVINGKTLFRNEEIENARILEIDTTSVTLLYAGEKHRLVLR